MVRASGILIALLLLDSQAGHAAYYSVTGGGVQFQIGDGVPLPLQDPTTALGKQAATMTKFPPLLVPVIPDPAKALIQQTGGPDPKKMTIPPGVLHRAAPGPNMLGVKKHERILQIRTNIEFSAPAPALGAAVLRAGGRTGAPNTTFHGFGHAFIFYEKTVAQFGGPLRARVAPATPVRNFLFLGTKLPCAHPAFGGADPSCRALLFGFSPLGAFGAPFGFTVMTNAPPAMSPYIVNASIPKLTGRIAMSASAVKSGTLAGKATSTGFPWTTGRVIISVADAFGRGEKFTITGMDSRLNGVGTISLVSGSLADSPLQGQNANRGWLRLTVPEPSAAAGAAAAVVTLAVCHLLVRRRRGLL